MKKIIYTIVISSAILFMACKKDRTCACSSKETSTNTITPRNGGNPTVTVSNTSTESENTYSKVKKDDVTRIYGCNSRTEMTTNTYTTQVAVQTVTVIAGISFTTTNYVTADQKVDNSTEYTCEIK